MRDLTKSVMSYSWAMSLFGVKQMVNLLKPSQATKAFGRVTQATEDEFGDILKAAFKAGDSVQRGLIDLSFSVFTLGGALNPSKVTDAAAGLGERAAQGFERATSAPSSTPATPTNAPGSQPQSTGWGPVPPPPDK
jgi:hypothetical protein